MFNDFFFKEFNSDSIIAQFYLESGKILKLYKVADLSTIRLKKRDDNKRDKVFNLPKTVDDLNLPKSLIDTCIIVTDSCVYKIFVR